MEGVAHQERAIISAGIYIYTKCVDSVTGLLGNMIIRSVKD